MIHGITELVTSSCLSFLSLIVVVLRCISRFGITRHHGLDDYTMIAAWICSMGFTISFALMLHFGAGEAASSVGKTAAKSVLKTFFLAGLPYSMAMALTKIAMLIQYLRLVVVSFHRKLCWVLIWYNAVYTIATVAMFVVTCKPLPYFWDKDIANGTCKHNILSWYANTACDILSDVTLVLYPVLILKSLRLPQKQKYALIGVFALGGCGCVTSILRLHSLFVAAKSDDRVKDSIGLFIWSSAEINISIMCGCLPTIRPVLGSLFPRLLSANARLYDRSHARSHARSYARSHARSQRLDQHIEQQRQVVIEEEGVPSQELPSCQTKKSVESIKRAASWDNFKTPAAGTKQKSTDLRDFRRTWNDFHPNRHGYQWSISGPDTPAQTGASKDLW